MTLSTPQKGSIYQKLCIALDAECKLYEEYIKAVNEEQTSVTKLSVEKLRELTNLREKLLGEMSSAQRYRQQLVSDLGENPATKLSEVAKKHFTKESSSLLNRKIERLRILVSKSQTASKELNLIVSFSQRLANGCMAILASATNNVFRSYSPYGKMKEAYHPSSTSKGTRRI